MRHVNRSTDVLVVFLGFGSFAWIIFRIFSLLTDSMWRLTPFGVALGIVAVYAYLQHVDRDIVEDGEQ